MDFWIGLAWGIAWRIPVWVAALSVAEYAGHRWWLHGRALAIRYDWAWRDYREHAIEHHARGRNERRPHIHLNPLMYFPATPFLVAGLLRAWHGSPDGLAAVITIVAMCAGHFAAWNAMHRAIHRIDDFNWSMLLPWYQAVKRNHLLHHERPSRHFGIVFPWW